jgi:hypothetical protein
MTQSPEFAWANPVSVAIVSVRAHCLASTVMTLEMRNDPMSVSANRLTLLLYLIAMFISLASIKDKRVVMQQGWQ